MPNAVDLISQVPSVYTTMERTEEAFYSSSLGRDAGGSFLPLAFLVACQALPTLAGTLNMTLRAAELAQSHRNYKVGALAVMYSTKRSEMALIGGFNIKPQAGQNGDNFHAEQIAIAKGRKLGLETLAALSVIADPNDLDANPNQYPTLPPCSRCIEMFKSTPEVSPRTLILGANPDLTVCELYTVAHLYDPRGVKKLVEDPFPLATLEDLDAFDHQIVPQVIPKLLQLYQCEQA